MDRSEIQRQLAAVNTELAKVREENVALQEAENELHARRIELQRQLAAAK